MVQHVLQLFEENLGILFFLLNIYRAFKSYRQNI